MFLCNLVRLLAVVSVLQNMAVKGCFNTPTTNCAGGGGSSPGTVEAGWVGLVLISL